MLILEFFRWWYGDGLVVRIKSLFFILSRTADAFSIGLMFKTLFRPFKRLDAVDSGLTRSIDAIFRDLIDKLISRLIGFFARSFMIIAGFCSIIILSIVSIFIIILHLAMPVLPAIGIYLMLFGGIPYVSL